MCINQRVLKPNNFHGPHNEGQGFANFLLFQFYFFRLFFDNVKFGSIPSIDIHGSFKISEAFGRLLASLSNNLLKKDFKLAEITGAFSKLNIKGFL